MEFIVDNGAYTLRNMGDVAMLQATLAHSRRLYPDSRYHVLTSAPGLLERYCPGTSALPVESRNSAYLPPVAQNPARWKTFWRKVRGKKSPQPPGPQEFRKVFDRADGVLVAGGGFLNDLNARASLAILGMLAEARTHNIPVALFGQGLGPLENPELARSLGKVLKQGAWIGLREARRGPAIVARAEALPDRVCITGDDALGVAWEQGQTQPGQRTGIGISIRRIAYSGIENLHLERVRNGLAALRSRFKQQVVPLPISFNSFEDDAAAISSLTGEPFDPEPLADPLKVIHAAGQARLVLTGTYHAAVFSLAQGIPCICFHASEYYRDKLEGLSTQFPQGCALVDISREDASDTIAILGEQLWAEAEMLRPGLQQIASEQVRVAEEFYERALKAFHNG